jgi:hypothetical protein
VVSRSSPIVPVFSFVSNYRYKSVARKMSHDPVWNRTNRLAENSSPIVDGTKTASLSKNSRQGNIAISELYSQGD